MQTSNIHRSKVVVPCYATPYVHQLRVRRVYRQLTNVHYKASTQQSLWRRTTGLLSPGRCSAAFRNDRSGAITSKHAMDTHLHVLSRGGHAGDVSLLNASHPTPSTSCQDSTRGRPPTIYIHYFTMRYMSLLTRNPEPGALPRSQDTRTCTLTHTHKSVTRPQIQIAIDMYGVKPSHPRLGLLLAVPSSAPNRSKRPPLPSPAAETEGLERQCQGD